MKNHYLFISLLILLSGCSSYSSLSSFSSRKYTKGYFFDARAEKPVIAERSENSKDYGRTEPKVKCNTEIQKSIVNVKAEQVKYSAKQSVKLIIAKNPAELYKAQHTIAPIKAINAENVFKPGDDAPAENNETGTKNGLIGFIYVIVGILLIVVGVLLLDLIIFAGGSGGLIIISVFLALAALLFLILGLILCVKTLITKDKYKGFAIAGAILSIYLLIEIIRLLSLIKW
ncbi:MAG: hypothetical protein ACLQQ4_04935 [Bacteroidia bacterium]